MESSQKNSNKLMRMFLSPISPFSILIAGFYTFMWGLWVALPFWDTFGTSPIYGILSNWVPYEVFWGIAHMAVGVVVMLAAFDSLKFMKYATFFGFCLWTLVALGFALSDIRNAGIWVVGFLAATHGYMFLNVQGRAD